MTLCFWRGMWWRRSWFSLKGTVDTRSSGGENPSYVSDIPSTTGGSVHHADMGPERLSKHMRDAWPILQGNTPVRGISRRTINRFLEGRDGSRSIRPESLKVIRAYLVHEGVIVDNTVTFYKSRDAIFDALCQLYPAQVRTRKSLGEMMRKLSVT